MFTINTAPAKNEKEATNPEEAKFGIPLMVCADVQPCAILAPKPRSTPPVKNHIPDNGIDAVIVELNLLIPVMKEYSPERDLAIAAPVSIPIMKNTLHVKISLYAFVFNASSFVCGTTILQKLPYPVETPRGWFDK